MKLKIYNSYHVVACPALLLIEIQIIINCII